MAKDIEVLRELFRITEMRDGAVHKTEYVRDVWVLLDEAHLPPTNHQYAVKSSDYMGQTIRYRKESE
jgi:hypothetical protein